MQQNSVHLPVVAYKHITSCINIDILFLDTNKAQINALMATVTSFKLPAVGYFSFDSPWNQSYFSKKNGNLYKVYIKK